MFNSVYVLIGMHNKESKISLGSGRVSAKQAKSQALLASCPIATVALLLAVTTEGPPAGCMRMTPWLFGRDLQQQQ